MTKLFATIGLVLLLSGSAHAAPFDGAWSVTQDCPDVGDIKGYNYRYVARIKDGVLHGQYGIKGKPSSVTLEGRIQSDGTAVLKAKGISGITDYALTRLATGSAYSFDVTARFEGSRGSGNRVGGRVCNFTFVKQ